jgi:hypothetical protein
MNGKKTNCNRFILQMILRLLVYKFLVLVIRLKTILIAEEKPQVLFDIGKTFVITATGWLGVGEDDVLSYLYR